VLLGAIAIAAHFTSPEDPTGAAASYDESVDTYNDRIDNLAASNPELPAIQRGRTFLQAHKEDTLFWILVAGVVTTVGLLLFIRQYPGFRSARR
ncbi:MAG: hypothetical protein KDA45_17820, partial [Planctomycetales bacterium]|nr:hypothetical protein [Planctomycetales bacterium]